MRPFATRILSGSAALGAVAGLAFAQQQPDDLHIPMPQTTSLRAGPGAQPAGEKPEFPFFSDVAKGYHKIISTASGQDSLYTLYKRDRDQGLLAELPRGYEHQKHFFAMTVASGDTWAGLQGDTVVVYWKRFDKNIALVEPNYATRSTGDPESKSGVAQQFTDKVLLDVPIVCIGPDGQPVIDLKALLTAKAKEFFGHQAQGADPKLALIKEAKAFPENIEVSVEMPASGGLLKTYHYSISLLPENTSYKPRLADDRVGYFTTSFRDLGQFRDDKKWVRYVNRWDIEKRDPSLEVSPPKNPIVFYIDCNVPVRYRRYIRQGILEWNKAFEKIGIADAIEVYYQDRATGANMDKDPEDVRYNFVRWLSNDQGTSIGPSRTDPRTGQILSADVVLTDGWIRYYWFQANQLLPDLATEGMGPGTMAWLDQHPSWDPRILLADPQDRAAMLAQRAARGLYNAGPASRSGTRLYGSNQYDGLIGRTSQFNGLCLAARAKGMDMAFMRMNLELAGLLEMAPPGHAEASKEGKDGKKTPEEEKIDGIPEWFLGPELADLTAHEIGHTLGLRHNFKASSIYTFKQINSDEVKGKKPFAGSVMDYIPVNINAGAIGDKKAVQGDYCMSGIGPYDYWAIQYGYGFGEYKDALKRVSEPDLKFLTDEDTVGSDPLAQRYDFGADPLDYAENQMQLIKYYRGRLIKKFVKDGESWAKARRGYLITLAEQMQALRMMSRWVGGAYVNREHKGDPGAKPPIEVTSPAKQRAALQFVIDNAFNDEAFGLSPELLQYLTVDKWLDEGGMHDAFEDSAYPVHDRVIGVQSTALTMLMNPTVLKRVYDNEMRVPNNEPALTLPELLGTLTKAIFSELDQRPDHPCNERQPMISSLRRNLQREYLDRLTDLTRPGDIEEAASKPISNLAMAQLRAIRAKIKKVESDPSGIDQYTLAHLNEAGLRIDKVLDPTYIYNANQMGGGGVPGLMFARPEGDGASQSAHWDWTGN